MATKKTTEERIFEGALSALARQGPRKLAMSDVCEEAGIARGTLYRYFSSKEELLEALADYVSSLLSASLEEQIAEHHEPIARVEVVVDTLIGFWERHPEMSRIGRLETAFSLSYVERRVLPRFRVVLHEVLDPVLSENALVKNGTATVDDIVDVMLRVAFSHFFVPMENSTGVRHILIDLASPPVPEQISPARRRKSGLAS